MALARGILLLLLLSGFAAAQPEPTHDEMVRLLREKVKYVFVLFQENRSFDSYFGTFPGAEGLFTHPPEETPGFYQAIQNIDGTYSVIHPFRMDPKDYPSDTDDVDHSHPLLVAKMNFQSGVPLMDQYAIVEERKFSPPTNPPTNPSLKAKQMGELTMAYSDCNNVPFLWFYADRFVLFDHIFQEMTGPSTLGNLSIIAAQTGQTQWALHPDLAYTDNGSTLRGVPVMNDNDPFWGSQLDPTPAKDKLPVAPRDLNNGVEYGTALNLTFATLPLTLLGRDAPEVTAADRDAKFDLSDVSNDVPFIAGQHRPRVAFGWYEEGFDREPTDPGAGPIDANGNHASYVAHHNSPQYFGYVANNPRMVQQLHGLQDFFDAMDRRALPAEGGVFYVKGGYTNILGLKPAHPDSKVQTDYLGDDDHPGYSDSQISEALVATAVNRIARSPYWEHSAIVITWDDSEGDYDHVPPPVNTKGPDGSVISNGPRVPLILLSPYARTHEVLHQPGSHASVVKFIDTVFHLPPLGQLPDEVRGRELGQQRFNLQNLGPRDADPNVTDLVEAFSPARLQGKAAPLPGSYVDIKDELVKTLPQVSGYGCKDLGIVTTDRAAHIANRVPADFNPRPVTIPTPVPK
jgi:phospholipase C